MLNKYWQERQEIRPVLSVDISGYSEQEIDVQLEAVSQLTDWLQQCVANLHGSFIWSSGGDGGSLTFDDRRDAVVVARELMKTANSKQSSLSEDAFPIRLRVGLHADTVIVAKDAMSNCDNVWGNGINYAYRIANVAKPGQILASREFCVHADLIDIGGKPKEKYISYYGVWWVKHGIPLVLYQVTYPNRDNPVHFDMFDSWYEPFHEPLQAALHTYHNMLSAQLEGNGVARSGLKTLAVSKRILDLDNSNEHAKRVVEQIALAKVTDINSLYCNVLSLLSSEALKFLLLHSSIKHFQSNEQIAFAGNVAHELFIIISGEIMVSIQNHIFYAHEGEIVGEMALFGNNAIRNADMITTTPTSVIVVPYRLLEPFQYDSPLTDIEISYCQNIKDTIWTELYSKRVVEHQLASHSLFKNLTQMQQVDLAKRAETLTDYKKGYISLDVRSAWDFITIVASGELKVINRFDGNHRNYGDATINVLGAIRELIVSKSPFGALDFFPNTFLILLPWNAIKQIAADNELFHQDILAWANTENDLWDGAIAD